MSAFLRRGVRAGLYGADDIPSVSLHIVDYADDKLFRDIFIKPTSYTTPLSARTDHTPSSSAAAVTASGRLRPYFTSFRRWNE